MSVDTNVDIMQELLRSFFFRRDNNSLTKLVLPALRNYILHW